MAQFGREADGVSKAMIAAADRKASASVPGSTFDDGAPNELCFSLVCTGRTLDLQCETSEARDKMVAGFRLLISS